MSLARHCRSFCVPACWRQPSPLPLHRTWTEHTRCASQTSNAAIISRQQRAAQVSDQIQALSRRGSERSRTPGDRRRPTSPGKRRHAAGPEEKKTWSEGQTKEPEDMSSLQQLQLLEQYDKETPAAVPFEPELPHPDSYTNTGQGTATIAGGNFGGVLEDIVQRLSGRTQDDFRHASALAKRMMKRGYVDLRDEAERSAVVAAADAYEDKRLATVGPGAAKASQRKVTEFSSMGPNQRKELVDRFVRGKHASLQSAKGGHRFLNEARRSTTINGSYGAKSAATFADTIRELMPARPS